MVNLFTTKIKILFMVALVLSFHAKAQNESRMAPPQGGQHVGNGGDVIFCSSGEPFKVMALDLFEEMLRFKSKKRVKSIDWNLALDDNHPQGFKNREAVDLALVLLAGDFNIPFPQRFLLQSGIEAWSREAEFPEGIELNDIPDSQHVGIPKGCQIRQLVVQGPLAGFNFELPDAYYVVDQVLWDMLPRFQQALMILHEIYYRDQVLRGATNSIVTRFIVGSIAQNFLASQTKQVITLDPRPLYSVPKILVEKTDTTEWFWSNVGLVRKGQDLIWCEGGMNLDSVLVADQPPTFRELEKRSFQHFKNSNPLMDCFRDKKRNVFIAEIKEDKVQYEKVRALGDEHLLKEEGIPLLAWDSAGFIDKKLDIYGRYFSKLKFVFAPKAERKIRFLGQLIDLSLGGVAILSFNSTEYGNVESWVQLDNLNKAFKLDLKVVGIGRLQGIGLSGFELSHANKERKIWAFFKLAPKVSILVNSENLGTFTCSGDQHLMFEKQNEEFKFVATENKCRPTEPLKFDVSEKAIDPKIAKILIGKMDLEFSIQSSENGNYQIPKKVTFDSPVKVSVVWGVSRIEVGAKELAIDSNSFANSFCVKWIKLDENPIPVSLKFRKSPKDYSNPSSPQETVSGKADFEPHAILMADRFYTQNDGDLFEIEFLPVKSTGVIPVFSRKFDYASERNNKFEIEEKEFHAKPNTLFRLKYIDFLEKGSVEVEELDTTPRSKETSGYRRSRWL